MEPSRNIRSNNALRCVRTAWFAVIFSALWAFVPVQLRAGVVVTTVFSFDGTNGSIPFSPLIQSSDGNFYGTTQGGFHNAGTVFSLTPLGDMNILTTFYGTNGSDPVGPIVQTSDGSIYGTTYLGGNTNLGTIYRVSATGVIESLFSFDGTNGANPMGLILGPDGALHGVTKSGGPGYTGNQFTGQGTIFRIDTNGNFSTIFTFNGTNGLGPYRMILGSDGIFYGTTFEGGAGITNDPGYGTVFKLVPGGPLTTLYSFNNTDGAGPRTIIQGSDGALYGVTQGGGSTATSPFGANGTVYRITTNGIFTKLADCDSATQQPLSIVQATDGTLYGSSIGSGTIFRVDPEGVLTVVYDFSPNAPPSNLVQIPGGAIYGTSSLGGIYSFGSIFRLDVTPAPPLLQLVSAQNNQLTLSWNAGVGYNYQVQSCADLFQQGWTNVGSAFMATNSTMSISPIVNSTQGGFYRVVLLP